MSKLGSILGKDLTLYLLLKSYTKRLSWCVAMFHESLVSIGKSKAVAGLKHTVSLYLWAYSIHNQRKMEGRSFLFLFYKEVFQPWPDNRPFTNYKIKLIPITFFFFLLSNLRYYMDPITKSNDFVKLHTLRSIKPPIPSIASKPRLFMNQSIL